MKQPDDLSAYYEELLEGRYEIPPQDLSLLRE